MDHNTQFNLKAPGWNDPPTISFETSANAPPKRILNKRVAIPMNQPYQGGSGIDPTIPPAPIDAGKIGKPPVNFLPPPPKSGSLPPSSKNEVQEENIRDRLREVLHNFRSTGNYEKDEEIEKRLNLLETMWLDNKLDNEVMKKIIELSAVFKANDLETADRLQKSLMVDHISQCSSWMGGVRQLINKIKSTSDEVYTAEDDVKIDEL